MSVRLERRECESRGSEGDWGEFVKERILMGVRERDRRGEGSRERRGRVNDRRGDGVIQREVGMRREIQKEWVKAKEDKRIIE